MSGPWKPGEDGKPPLCFSSVEPIRDPCERSFQEGVGEGKLHLAKLDPSVWGGEQMILWESVVVEGRIETRQKLEGNGVVRGFSFLSR